LIEKSWLELLEESFKLGIPKIRVPVCYWLNNQMCVMAQGLRSVVNGATVHRSYLLGYKSVNIFLEITMEDMLPLGLGWDYAITNKGTRLSFIFSEYLMN
jgi:hypothetical protein